MLWPQQVRLFLLSALIVSTALSSFAGSRNENASRDDKSWKRYTNKQVGYCVSYPRRWQKGDAFEGAGIA